jgi:hypothetical protein
MQFEHLHLMELSRLLAGVLMRDYERGPEVTTNIVPWESNDEYRMKHARLTFHDAMTEDSATKV